MKNYYLFDQTTFEYLPAPAGVLYTAHPNPEEPGKWLVPESATLLTPPPCVENQIPIFTNGKWTIQPDFRGETWFDAQGNGVEIVDIGTPPSTLTQTLPPAIILERAKADQTVAIDQACAVAIMKGFTSSALGVPHTYPSKMEDQQNLAANVLSSTLPNGQVAGWTTPQICATQDPTPVWAYLSHTAAEIQQVGEDGKAAILNHRMRNQTLQDQIAQATTVAGVAAVMW